MYNSEKTIESTIQSVVRQTRYDLIEEIIVVDDGSTDKSSEIVQLLSLCNPIIKYIRQENKGAAAARNNGIRVAKEDMIALLDSDDIWDEKKIAVQESVLNKYQNIRAIGSNRTGEEIHLGIQKGSDIYRISPLLYCIKCWPCTPSLIFDKKVFVDGNYFPEDMTHAEEGLFFLKLASECGLYYINEPLVTCGGGKRAFGDSGLSGNVDKMHIGVKEMIKRAGKNRYISPFLIPFLIFYEDIKYCRRKIIIYLSQKKTKRNENN